ncbi:MAG: hypothetical protein LBE61_03785 [Burkholderiaceae bacterium]|jgi:hypothetical protein|nr:hypothetical protein [Burkholderiaceae bacterium]
MGSKVADGSVASIVCGTLQAHKQLSEALAPSLNADIIEQEVVEAWQLQARRNHESNLGLQRDEAVRTASLTLLCC